MQRLLILVVVVACLAWASPSEAACGGTPPNRTAGNFADLSDCATNYTEGDTITVTANITMTSGLTFANGGFTITAATECGVTLSHNAGAVMLLTVSRDLTHDTTIKNIRFAEGASHGSNNGAYYLYISGPTPTNAANYNPVLALDNCFVHTDGGLDGAIRLASVGGVIIAGNTFDASGPGNTCAGSGGRCDQAINITDDAASESWTTAHTMGTADTDGLKNVYIENNQFIQFINQAIDTSANARVVFRYNTMTESAGAAHGADTSPHGMRHVEYYNNTFTHVYYGDNGTGCTQTIQVSRGLNIRGGTAVLTDNDFTGVDNDSCWGGDNAKRIQVEIQNLRRADAQYPCWGANNATYPTYADSVYPAYHQVGRGTYNGSVALTSTGDLDPVYLWSNTGTPTWYPTDYANECGASADAIADYVQLNRDYYLSARPSYTKYAYPHPLISGGGGGGSSAPARIRLVGEEQ